MKLGLIDPSIFDDAGAPSPNLGDLIISQGVIRELEKLFPGAQTERISSHRWLDLGKIVRLRGCKYTFVGGSNLLSSKMREYRQWQVSLRHSFLLKKVILLGVGWWQYQDPPDFYTRRLLSLALEKTLFHSVRDTYTAKMLREAGFANVINTGCPSMWPLADLGPGDFPRSKSRNVLTMLTDYNQAPELDRKLLTLLCSKYDKVFVWPQGDGDAKYVTSMGLPVTLLGNSMSAVETFIGSQPEFDYVGTRLHGGVRCLLARKRSLIIKIDNRATEIARDTGLPVVERSDFAYMENWISQPYETRIRMNVDAIARWRDQFIGNSQERPQARAATGT